MFPSLSFESDVETNVKTVVITSWVDLESFNEKLQKLKRIGVDAIFRDVEWHAVEQQRGIFDWDHHIGCVEAIAGAGLLCILQISAQFVPTWVWRSYPDAKFVNEFNETSEQYMSFWHPQTKPLIQRYYSEFFTAFRDYSETIYGIYVSAGMWSELIYPWIPEEQKFAYWGYDVYAKADFTFYKVCSFKEYVCWNYSISAFKLS